MPSDHSATLRLRLEDIIALAFFLVTLFMRIVFRGRGGGLLSPADVLAIIPAVSLLLGKELVHYFVSRPTDGRVGSSLGDFARPYWVIVRDWLPFLFVLLMYYSLWGDTTHLVFTRDRDAALMAWDQKLFGCQASVALQRWTSPPLTAWMTSAYVFHLLNIPIVAGFIYTRRPRERFREMMSGVLVINFFGLLGYLLVPAIGPMYTLRDAYTVPLSQPLDIFNRQVEFMDFARIRRDVFPSMHVGLSFLVWLYALRNSRRLFWILSPLIVSLWISTVYLRYHYVVDGLAGLVLAPVCFWLANAVFRRYGVREFPVVLGLPRAGLSGAVPKSPAKVAKIEERP